MDATCVSCIIYMLRSICHINYYCPRILLTTIDVAQINYSSTHLCHSVSVWFDIATICKNIQ